MFDFLNLIPAKWKYWPSFHFENGRLIACHLIASANITTSMQPYNICKLKRCNVCSPLSPVHDGLFECGDFTFLSIFKLSFGASFCTAEEGFLTLDCFGLSLSFLAVDCLIFSFGFFALDCFGFSLSFLQWTS